MNAMSDEIAELYANASQRWPDGEGMTKTDFDGLKKRLLEITASNATARDNILEPLYTMYGHLGPGWMDDQDEVHAVQ